MHILYVDDEPAMLSVTEEYLKRRSNFQVDTADSAGMALEKMKETIYDAIVSDYQMPGMDGIGFLKYIREHYGTIPFILFTGKGREEVVIQALENGADFYLQKGGDPKSQFTELIHKINQAIKHKQAEDELRESEERYRNVIEDQTEFICRFLPDGTHIFVNDAYCRYFKKKRKEVVGHRFKPRLHPEDREIVRCHIASLTPKNPVKNIDQRIIMPDGSTHWQRWSDRAIFNADGQLVEFQSVGRDITEQKETERALLKSKTELHAVLYGSPIPKFVIDNNHRIIYWNKALEQYSGIREEEIVGTDQQWRAFYPSKRPCIADLIVNGDTGKISHLYKGEYHKSKFFDDAYKATDFFPKLGKNGAWMHFTAAPIRDEKGNIIGAVETLEDITDLKRAEDELRKEHEELLASHEELTSTEEELRQNYNELARSQRALAESEDRYRAFFTTSIDCVFITSLDGRWLDFNDSAVQFFGYSGRDDLKNVNIRDLYADPRDRERHLAHIKEKGYSREYPVNLKKKDGTVISTLITTVPIKETDGTIIRFQGTIHDVTERKKREDALQKANQQLTLLSSVTRHDILNKVSILLGYLALLRKKTDPAEISQFTEKMEAATRAIQDEIEFTRKYQELGTKEPQWLDMKNIIGDCIIPPAITFHVDIPSIEVYADPMLGKVFPNLLDNSARHGEKVTKIRLSGRETPDGFQVNWEDDGIGIPGDEKEKIFMMGYGRHSGFGLFFVREILSVTGISIKETGEPEKGARFEILLPKESYRMASQP